MPIGVATADSDLAKLLRRMLWCEDRDSNQIPPRGIQDKVAILILGY